MNEKVRSLQREWSEKHLEASALLSKAEVPQADEEKAAAFMARIEAIKGEIDREFKLVERRAALDGMKRSPEDGESDVRNFMHSGQTKQSRVGVLGMTKAGAITIDSFGTAIDDFQGGGAFSAKRWDAMCDPVYSKAFVAFIRSKGNFTTQGLGDPAYFKALQEGLDDQGGVFVPPEMLQRVIGREPTPTRVAGKVTTITTSRDRVTMPRTQYSTDDLYATAFRATWTGEIPSSSTAADVTDTDLFGNVAIDVFTAMLSGSITNDMAEDSFFPIQGWMETQFRNTDALLRDNMVLNGTGIFQPSGILKNPDGTGEPSVIQSGTANDISADAIVDLPYRVPEQYMDNCEWVFNRTSTERAIAKLKDAENRYLFSDGTVNQGVANSRPTNLVGFPICRSGFMPNIGDGAYPIVFGDLRGVYLANRLGITIQILRETKAKLNQFEVVARTRFGCKVVEPWKIKILKSDNA